MKLAKQKDHFSTDSLEKIGQGLYSKNKQKTIKAANILYHLSINSSFNNKLISSIANNLINTIQDIQVYCKLSFSNTVTRLSCISEFNIPSDY